VHNWSPNWETSVFGSYTSVDLGGTTSLLCANNGTPAGMTRTGSCNPNYNIAQVGTRTAWTPVQNLTFSAEAMYTMLDTSQTGSITTTTAPVAFKPAGSYQYKDENIWSGNVRVRRTF
jgi:hypothetical protein